jgi:hypothetical protein
MFLTPLQTANSLSSLFLNGAVSFYHRGPQLSLEEGPLEDLNLQGPFEKFVDSPYYSESELRRCAVTTSFSKYFPWQVMHSLQRSTHFSKTCCRPFAPKLQEDSGTGGFDLSHSFLRL